jgi:hypothetical protein
VIGATKIVDPGPDNVRWNLVVIGFGYRSGELANYDTHTQNFVTTLRTTPPFNELFRGINIHRIDVVSNDSGADDPGCAPAERRSPRTRTSMRRFAPISRAARSFAC